MRARGWLFLPLAVATLVGCKGDGGGIRAPEITVESVTLTGPSELHPEQTASYHVKVVVRRVLNPEGTFDREFVLLRQKDSQNYFMRQRLTFGPNQTTAEADFALTSTHPDPPPHMPALPNTVHYRNDAGTLVNTLRGSRTIPPKPPLLPQPPPLDDPLRLEAFFSPMASAELDVLCVP